MDDRSLDGSGDLLNNYSKNNKVSHLIVNDVNSGSPFGMWEMGFELAKGELIWFAETDDYCDIHFLEKLVKPFQKYSQVVLAYCQSNRVNEKGEVTGSWITQTDDLDKSLFHNDFIMDSNEFIEKYLIYRNVIPNASAVVFRREDVDINKHFDIGSEFRYCGDWMFYFKLIVNKKVAFISDSLNNFRYHQTSVIAKAIQAENRITFMNIEYKLRFVLMHYLEKIKISNYDKIKERNNFIKRNFIIYEKALLLIQSGKKLKGYLMMLTVYDVYLNRHNVKKRILKRIKKIFT